MITFKDELMQRMVPDIEVYYMGIRLSNKVTDFEYIKNIKTIKAAVQDTNPCKVEIEIGNNCSVNSYFCECEDFKTCFGACKHVVAVMNYTNHYCSRPAENDFSSAGRDGFLSLAELGIENCTAKQKINLGIEQSIKVDVNSGYPYIQLKLKIGLARLYMVKDIPMLLEAYNSRRTLYFGDRFTYEPDTMYFEGIDEEIMDFLGGISRREKSEREFYGVNDNSINKDFGIIRQSTVLLIEDDLKKYLEIVKDCRIPVKYFDERSAELRFRDDLEISLYVRTEEDFLIAELDCGDMKKLLPLTKDHTLVLNTGTLEIHRIPPVKARLMERINQIRKQNKSPVFKVGKNEHRLFIRGFFNYYREHLKIVANPVIEDRLAYKELTARIYFDAYKKGICAKIDFCYGDNVINPLDDSMESYDCFYMRDYQQEERIIDFLKESGMRNKSGMLILEDDEKIAELLNEKLEGLGKLAEIYYSEEFKKIQIRAVRNLKVGVSFNSNLNLLEFNFELDGIDDSELNRLFSSIKLKKKYFRLKDGDILKLDSRELVSVSELLDSLNLENLDFKNGAIDLPSNRALFIDSYLSEKIPHGFQRDDRFKTLVKNITEPVDLELSLDEKLEKVLRGYQKFGLKWLKMLSIYGLGGILADDMGLGKTLQVLAFINMEKAGFSRPCLVVAPTSLVYNWKSEALKFVPELKVEVIYGIKTDRKKALKKAGNADIIVTSYGSLKSDIEEYSRMEFSYIFIDEAQHIKNPNTLNANSVKRLKARGCFALTGTPIENSLTELWSIFDFIMPGYLMNYRAFVSKFEKPIVLNNDKESLNRLSKLIKPFILRRLKSEVLKELPEKIESLVVSDMTREQRKLYAAYVRQAREEVAVEIKERGLERSRIKILALLTRLRQLCCHPSMFIEDYKAGSGKLETLLEIISDSIDSGHRMLLFSQFTSMHRIIGKELAGLGIEYFYLDGATKAAERIDMAERFNNGEKKLFLISLKAGGTGLNLTGADMVIHFDPWWNPAVEDQATDRAYRIGQNKVVQVFKIITKGTIEEKIYELQQRKKGLINNVIKPGENLLTKLSEDEIHELFCYDI